MRLAKITVITVFHQYLFLTVTPLLLLLGLHPLTNQHQITQVYE